MQAKVVVAIAVDEWLLDEQVNKARLAATAVARLRAVLGGSCPQYW